MIGVISDTHGLLRPQAVEALRGVCAILHAGDVGHADVLAGLAELAPVTAIRGNVDTQPWARSLPEQLTVTLEGLRIRMVHDLGDLTQEPGAAADVVVFGHSHRPLVERRGSTLFLNPGSAGRRRFRLPVTLAHLWDDGDGARARLIDLPV